MRARRPSWDAVEEAVQAGRPLAFVLDVATVLRTSPKHILKGERRSLSGGRSGYEESK